MVYMGYMFNVRPARALPPTAFSRAPCIHAAAAPQTLLPPDTHLDPHRTRPRFDSR